jgi:hypothetical protein
MSGASHAVHGDRLSKGAGNAGKLRVRPIFALWCFCWVPRGQEKVDYKTVTKVGRAKATQ